jgi:hypothetical protein
MRCASPVGDPAQDGPEIAERLPHLHPNINDVSFPERSNLLPAERIHAGTAAFSFSLRKSARAISA